MDADDIGKEIRMQRFFGGGFAPRCKRCGRQILIVTEEIKSSTIELIHERLCPVCMSDVCREDGTANA